jgi:hypothetical protein
LPVSPSGWHACLWGGALGLLAAWLDQRPGVALLPRGAYSLPRLPGRLYACIALLMIASMSEIFVPYFLQDLHGYTPLQAGYLTAVMAAGWSLASLSGAGCRGRNARRMLLAGPLLMTLSLALAGAGLGIGLGWPHLLTQVLHTAPRGEGNLASAGITTVQLYAMAMGAALAGLTANAAGLSGTESTQMAARSLFALFALAPLLVMYLVARLPREGRA